MPTHNLSRAGILMHAFAGSDDPARPWRPCETSFCRAVRDRTPATLVNQRRPHLFHDGCGGFILSANAVEVMCSYYADGGSNNIRCRRELQVAKAALTDENGECLAGCGDIWCTDLKPRLQSCHAGCAWKPTQLLQMMQQQEASGRLHACNWNEVRQPSAKWRAAADVAGCCPPHGANLDLAGRAAADYEAYTDRPGGRLHQVRLRREGRRGEAEATTPLSAPSPSIDHAICSLRSREQARGLVSVCGRRVSGAWRRGPDQSDSNANQHAEAVARTRELPVHSIFRHYQEVGKHEAQYECGTDGAIAGEV